jgi:hypothetical protein
VTTNEFFKKFDQFAVAPNAVKKMRELILEFAVKGNLVSHEQSEEVDVRFSDEPRSSQLPDHWRLLNFGKYCDIQGGNQPPKSQFSNVDKPGYIRLFQIRDLGDKPVPVYIKKSSVKRFCSDGDLLIGRYGASVGKIFWAQTGTYNVALAKFIYPSHAFQPSFAYWLLKSSFFQNQIATASRSAQAGFNKGDLADTNFPLPPLAEQKRIVAKVEELMALVDKLKAQQAQARELAERLMEAAVREMVESTQRRGAGLVLPRINVADEELREALLLSRIVSITADAEHPLGRFRRTKFSYLAHRRAGDDVMKHYIKKAAGPYSPWAKFDGPEDMARMHGYVRDTKTDPLEGMVAGESIAEVDEYVADPLVGDAVDWVMKHFHFETNDNLELYTTVDFAAIGLQNVDKEISRDEIKKVIARNKEWVAKLSRKLFSDENIDKALKRLTGYFPETYGK